MVKFPTIIWLVVIALGLTLFIVGDNKNLRSSLVDEIGSILPSTTLTPTPTSTPTPIVTKKPTPTPTVNVTPTPVSIAPAASCSLSGGRIVFLEPGVARNEEAQIIYKDIDDTARLIFWQSTPGSGGVLSIGPNMFAGLPLPDGQENVLVVADTDEIVKRYVLTAQVNYGVRDEDGVVIRTEKVDCSGEIEVEFSYL